MFIASAQAAAGPLFAARRARRRAHRGARWPPPGRSPAATPTSASCCCARRWPRRWSAQAPRRRRGGAARGHRRGAGRARPGRCARRLPRHRAAPTPAAWATRRAQDVHDAAHASACARRWRWPRRATASRGSTRDGYADLFDIGLAAWPSGFALRVRRRASRADAATTAAVQRVLPGLSGPHSRFTHCSQTRRGRGTDCHDRGAGLAGARRRGDASTPTLPSPPGTNRSRRGASTPAPAPI